MKKKMTALLMAFVLLMGMSVTAFAEDSPNPSTITKPGGSAAFGVTGSYSGGTGSGEKTYCVDVAWSDMNFTYVAASKGTWDTTEHIYKGATEAKWVNSNSTDQSAEAKGKITITNHSDAEIQANAIYRANNAYSAATMSIINDSNDAKGSAILYAASKDQVNSANLSVTPSGSLPANTPANTAIGTITVTISAA